MSPFRPSPTTTHPRSADEHGSALLLSLVLVGVVSVVIVSLLSLVIGNLTSTHVAQARTAQRYAADAAVEQAIEAVQNDRTLCDGPSAGARALPDLTVDGVTVSVTCEAAAGLAPGAGGWAIITTTTSQAGITTAGPGPVIVQGGVYSARLADSTTLTVDGGKVLERRSGSTCSTDANRPPGLVVRPDPPYHYSCTDEPLPEVEHALPSARPPVAPAPTTVADCKVFYPGTYTAPPALGPDNRFTSGTYYFHDVGRMLIENARVIGGERPDETRINSGSSVCDIVPEDPGAAGTGVKWVLGGTSWLDVGPNADVELYSRLGGAASEGQMGISLQAVTAPAPTGMAVNSRGAASPLVRVSGGVTGQLSIHGLLYAPGSFVDYFATTSTQAQLRGGVVVGRINLQSATGSSGLMVSS